MTLNVWSPGSRKMSVSHAAPSTALLWTPENPVTSSASMRSIRPAGGDLPQLRLARDGPAEHVDVALGDPPRSGRVVAGDVHRAGERGGVVGLRLEAARRRRRHVEPQQVGIVRIRSAADLQAVVACGEHDVVEHDAARAVGALEVGAGRVEEAERAGVAAAPEQLDVGLTAGRRAVDRDEVAVDVGLRPDRREPAVQRVAPSASATGTALSGRSFGSASVPSSGAFPGRSSTVYGTNASLAPATSRK